jgi:hypothetical protein
MLLVAAGSASANTIGVTWNGGTGNWSNSSQWTPAGVPNNAGGTTYSVDIGGTSAVTMDVLNATVDNINLAAAGSSLQIGLLNNFDSLTLVSGVSSNSGTLSISGRLNYYFVVGSALDNYGTLNNTSAGTLNNSGILNNNGGAAITNAGTLNNSGNLYNNLNAVLNNFGTLVNVKNSSGLLTNFGALNNYGVLNNNHGTPLRNPGTLNNFGVINNNFGALLQNTPLGPSSQPAIHNYFVFNNTGDLANGGLINNAGTFNNLATVPGRPAFIENGGIFINSGALTISGGVFTNGGSGLLQSTGTINVTSTGEIGNFGRISASQLSIGAGLVNFGTVTMTGGSPLSVLAGGALIGNGTVFGSVVNGGTLNPGSIPGTTINGNYTQLSSGVFLGELRTPFAGTQYPQLKITGMATLGGTLDIFLTPEGYSFNGLTFVIVDAGSLQGRFSVIDFLNFGCVGCSSQVTYGTNAVTVGLMTPEPASLVLTSTGLLGLAFGARRRRRAQRG